MREIENIVLIGFMGSGKSTIGRLLSERMNMPFREMDEVAREMSGRKSIADIFDKDGELCFREYELAAAERLSHERGTVIATGGGAVMNKVNIDRLSRTGRIVLLHASFSEIERRLHDDETRPLFRNRDEAKRLYAFRSPLYERYAHVIISADGRSPEHMVEEIVSICIK